jgi:lipopolysaccharide biosynthesis glycosyltransferase
MRYIDEYVGVDHRNYVNSGVLLMNMKRLREVDLSGCFIRWMDSYGLDCVAPDQDYLNALCRYGIHYLDPEWNAMPSECMGLMDDPQIVHFNLGSKPWLNESVPYDELFWKYAALSGYEKEIRSRRRAFLQDTNAMNNYKAAIKKLIHMAARLTEAPVSFRTLMTSHQTLRLCS